MEKEGNKKQQTRARIKNVGAKRFIENGLRETLFAGALREKGLSKSSSSVIPLSNSGI